MMVLNDLIRENVKRLIPYSAAREKFQGEGYVFLDANENPFGKSLNRYPDPYQKALKGRIGEEKGVDTRKIFIGNGSDEIIDLLIRAFCNPGSDNMIVPEPTYGMYEVAGEINDVEVRKPQLTEDFQPDVKSIMKQVDGNTKLIFLCSPNNPTANILDSSKVKLLLDQFGGLVVLDEAYIDFAGDPGFLPVLDSYPNLVILQTFSKARGMAGIRLGYGFAQEEIIEILNKIKYPYNVNRLTQRFALRKMKKPREIEKNVKRITRERKKLFAFLESCSFVERVFHSDANFLLVRVSDPGALVQFLADRQVIIRDRSGLPGCEKSVRITVGTRRENMRLMKMCREFEKNK